MRYNAAGIKYFKHWINSKCTNLLNVTTREFKITEENLGIVKNIAVIKILTKKITNQNSKKYTKLLKNVYREIEILQIIKKKL